MRVLKAVAVLVAVLASLGYGLYLGNRAPDVPALPEAGSDLAFRPFVVKLHAQWCPKCLATRGVWSEIQQTFDGRVNMLVLDFTNEATTTASRAEAARLGLGGVADDYDGVTGAVLVVDGTTHEVAADISSFDVGPYRTAIEAALGR